MHEFKKMLKILERGETHKGRNKEPAPETKKIFTNKKNKPPDHKPNFILIVA